MLQNTKKKSDLDERLGRSQDAKKALLAKFKPRPHAPDPAFETRKAQRDAELEQVRQARLDAKEAQRLAKLAEEEAALQQELLKEEDEVGQLRSERKARKAALKAEARAKRELQQELRQQLRRVG
ncbi:MAG TPA: DUF6481 family protein [Caulobacteraceae bacterium]|jgi:hypothetical protein|nr:DUF6481 family protein [Caulobacteraceae bacterium]